jgi:hypothetical protein
MIERTTRTIVREKSEPILRCNTCGWERKISPHLDGEKGYANKAISEHELRHNVFDKLKTGMEIFYKSDYSSVDHGGDIKKDYLLRVIKIKDNITPARDQDESILIEWPDGHRSWEGLYIFHIEDNKLIYQLNYGMVFW